MTGSEIGQHQTTKRVTIASTTELGARKHESGSILCSYGSMSWIGGEDYRRPRRPPVCCREQERSALGKKNYLILFNRRYHVFCRAFAMEIVQAAPQLQSASR